MVANYMKECLACGHVQVRGAKSCQAGKLSRPIEKFSYPICIITRQFGKNL